MLYVLLFYWILSLLWVFPGARNGLAFFEKGTFFRPLLFSLILLLPAFVYLKGVHLGSELRLNNASYLILIVVLPLFLRPLRFSGIGIFLDFFLLIILGSVFGGAFSFQSPTILFSGVEYRIDWLVAGPVVFFLFWDYEIPPLPHSFRHTDLKHYFSVALICISLLSVFGVTSGAYKVKPFSDIGMPFGMLIYLIFSSFLLEGFYRLSVQKVFRNFFESAFWFIPVLISSLAFGLSIGFSESGFAYGFMMTIVSATAGYFMFLSRSLYPAWLIHFSYMFVENLFFIRSI